MIQTATITAIKPSTVKNYEGDPMTSVELEWEGPDCNVQDFDINQLGDVNFQYTLGRGYGSIIIDGPCEMVVGETISRR